MFCTRCGTEIGEVKFCSECGQSSGRSAPWTPRTEKLMRPMREAKIAGVCAGFARHFGVDVTLMRIIWVVLAIWPLPLLGVVAYCVAWGVMPKDTAPVAADQMHPANL
jgi:phage shock protein C